MDNPQTKRTLLILVSAVDGILGAVVLLIYFGLLPIDISGLGIPGWVVGVVGGVWFLSAIVILAYQLSKTDISE
jgi:hypothetical protein